MPTITDIAKKAGVSHGTVSNVLNRKGNVSSRKIKKVEEAAKELGYKINYTAKTLRSGKTNAVSIILPNIESEEYTQLYIGLDKTLTELGFRTHLYISYDLPLNEKEILQEIASNRVRGVIAISCLDDAKTYYDILGIPEENILFINRKIKNQKKFFSFDFSLAGKQIQKYLSMKGYKSVGIFSDELKYSNEKMFVSNIKENLQVENLKIVNGSFNKYYKKAFEIVRDQSLDVIICSCLSKARMVRKAYFWGSTRDVPEIISLAPIESTHDRDILKFMQNYQLLGRNIAESFYKQIEEKIPIEDKIIFENSGFLHKTKVHKAAQQHQLSLLTIPSPTTNAIEKLHPHFLKETGIRLNIHVKEFDEIFKVLSTPQRIKKYDLIRFDMAWLSWFAEDVFTPLLQFDDEIESIVDNYPPYIQESYSKIHGTPYAIPLDPSIQMLFYRKDLFEDYMISRMYFEEFRKKLKPPQDFIEYNQIMNFFLKEMNIHGSSTIIGKSEIMASEFLARYYATGGRLMPKNNLIQLDFERAKNALQNFIEMVHLSNKIEENWWSESVEHFTKGETAMFLGFMNHISQIAYSDIGPLVGHAIVPGGKPLLGGGVIGITKHSKLKKQATQFLKWINNKEVSEQITLLGGIPTNLDILDNQNINTLFPWLEQVEESIKSGIRETKNQEGLGINLREVEEIIGSNISQLLHSENGIDQTIYKINNQLKKIKAKS